MVGHDGHSGGIVLVQESPWRWRIDATGAMRVPGVVFASQAAGHVLVPSFVVVQASEPRDA